MKKSRQTDREIKAALKRVEAALGRLMSLPSVYTLLHRHDWRKLAPDKCRPQSDPVAQDEWEKLLETRQDLCKEWQGKPIRFMFPGEARFGRINDVRRCFVNGLSKWKWNYWGIDAFLQGGGWPSQRAAKEGVSSG